MDRRQFVVRSSALSSFAMASFGAPWGVWMRLPASDVTIAQQRLEPTDELERLVRLLHETSGDECVRVFAKEVRNGLSYQDFIGALFFAALRNGDPHQLAQIYAAHRLSLQAPDEARWIPLFWALDRVRSEYDAGQPPRTASETATRLAGSEAERAFVEATKSTFDVDQAEASAVILVRQHGARNVMTRLWELAARRTSSTLGHLPIALANLTRTLDTLGWQRAEPFVRYVVRYATVREADSHYVANADRAKRHEMNLPVDWTVGPADRGATLELFDLIRSGQTDDVCDVIATQLTSGRTKVSSVWDAIHLAAFDLLYRHKTGGAKIGSILVHAVTSTNALRYGFDDAREPGTRMLLMLQAAAQLSGHFVFEAKKEDELRERCLLDLATQTDDAPETLEEIFAHLPLKARQYEQQSDDERMASDEACRWAYRVLQQPGAERAFLRATRSLLCAKATRDPHDVKFPIAAFEDADRVSPEWRHYLLAASLHATHGTASPDAQPLLAAQDAIG